MRTNKQPARSRSFTRGGKVPSRTRGRTLPAAKRRGSAPKGLLIAAAPMIGGLVMKKMRNRQQSKRHTAETVSG